MKRRVFLHRALGLAAAAVLPARAASSQATSLAGQVGITTGTFSRHLPSGPGTARLDLLDLPKLMRDELDLRVIDLMTATVPSLEPAYLERLRIAADRAGCVITNLKMNQPGLDLASPDETIRRPALEEYKRTMALASRLGVRWVRPLPGRKRGDLARLVSSYRELIEHGAPLGITVLIENFGWLQDQPDGIPNLIAQTGPGLHAQPDTGNWADAVRYDGLARAFPLAVSCDFKARVIEPDSSHPAYDLERCFRLGWEAGFRGPWCLEYSHPEFDQLLRNLALLRDRLRAWMRTPPR